MDKILLIVCCLAGMAVCHTCYGQEKKQTPYKSGSRSAGATLGEAERQKYNDPEQALQAVQEALSVSLEQGDAMNEARSYLLLGEINEGIGEWSLALENFERAYERLKGGKIVPPEYARALRGMGNASLNLGRYPDALGYFTQAMELVRGAEKAERQLDISEVYYRMEKYAQALEVVSAIRLGGKAYDAAMANRIQSQKAKINARLNNIERTKELYDSSLITLRAASTPTNELRQQQTKEDIANVYRSQNRYDDEIDLRNKSIAYNLESNNLAEAAKDKVELGKVLDAKGEREQALRATREAARLTDTLNSQPRAQAYAYLALADLYEKSEKPQEAIEAYRHFSYYMSRADTVNQRELNRRADLIKLQKDIEEMTKNVSIAQREETIQQQTVFRQQLIIYGLLFLLAVIAVTSYFIYKNAQASKRANQLLALKSLRSQMNPHFIFNALNSVNHFVAQQDERAANRFLSEFSQLMRLVLENSQEDFISLQKEQEILSLYLKLEHYRFRDKFDYSFEIDPSLNADAIRIPPMLIQPYIENAVWHGLRYRDGMGRLALRFTRDNGALVVNVTDNGIGRKRSAELKTANQKKHTSTGLKNIQERLDILNSVYKTRYRVTIHDLADGAGTDVRLYLPLEKHHGL